MPGPVGKRVEAQHGHRTAAEKERTKVDIASLFGNDEPAVSSVRDVPNTEQPARAPWEVPASDPSPHAHPIVDKWSEEDGVDVNHQPEDGDVMDHQRAPRIPLQFDPPPPNPKWEPAAKEWYLSLHESGQAIFYEPSDWATAYLMAESLSRDLAPQFVGINETTGKVIRERLPLKGASLGAYLKGFSQLMATEGERRRMRIELERFKVGEATKKEETNVVSIREGLV